MKRELAERLITPHLPASTLSDFDNHYTIKLRVRGYRLVCEVIEREVVILVIAIGKRDKDEVYRKAHVREK